MTQAVKTEHCHVHRDPAVCGGDPVIVGTRIPVRLIYQRTQAGDSIDQIRQAYPHLTLAQIHDALSYSYDHLADIQAELRREARTWEQQRADPSH
jgi:uncharacterized protein (DUF433 family)